MVITELPSDMEPPRFRWGHHSSTWDKRLDFLGFEANFPDGSRWELVQPLSNFVEEFKANPPEGRLTCLCRLLKQADSNEVEYPNEAVMKIRVQLDAHHVEAVPEPPWSIQTSTEIKALQIFATQKCQAAPWLLGYHLDTQPDSGFVEGGYICYILMTKLPGHTIAQSNFWGLAFNERSEIRLAFKQAASSVIQAGCYPVDSRPENVIWDSVSRKCFLIDFESSQIGHGNDTDWLPDYLLGGWGLIKSNWDDMENPWG